MKRWFITITACLLILAGLAGFKYLEVSAAIEKGKAYPEPSETVYAAKTRELTYQPSISLMGELIAPRRLDVRTERPGKIIRLNFSAGDSVVAGQVLAQLDASTEKAQLSAAEADEALAEKTWQRMKALKKQNKVSIERYDQARAKLDASRAAISQLNSIIKKNTLIAPFDATAGIQSLELGQYLATNDLLTTLVGLDDFFWLDFNLPQGQMPLTIGGMVRVIGIEGDDLPPLKAQIIAEDSVVSGSARTLKYRAKLSQPAAYMRAHGRVLVEVSVGQALPMAAVSDESITRDQFGAYVYVLSPESDNAYRASRRKVKLTPKIDRQYGVVSGLKIGTLVASRGAFKLRDGLKVYIQSGEPDDGMSLSRKKSKESVVNEQ